MLITCPQTERKKTSNTHEETKETGQDSVSTPKQRLKAALKSFVNAKLKTSALLNSIQDIELRATVAGLFDPKKRTKLHSHEKLQITALIEQYCHTIGLFNNAPKVVLTDDQSVDSAMTEMTTGDNMQGIEEIEEDNDEEDGSSSSKQSIASAITGIGKAMATGASISNMSTAVSVGSKVTGVGTVDNIPGEGETASVASAITGVELMNTGGAGSIASAVTGFNGEEGENESQQSAITGIGMDVHGNTGSLASAFTGIGALPSTLAGTDTPGKAEMGDKQQGTSAEDGEQDFQ